MESTELTVESAASQFEGLLSAEDGTQEPEEKEAPESTEAEPGDEAEGETAEEPEESEDAESEEESEAEPSYTVKIDGKDAKVPLKELLSGYQRTADYSRKTMALAEERKAFQSESESVKAEREHYAAQLDKVKSLIEQAQPKEPDWDNLIAQDPIGAYRLKLQHDRYQENLRAVEAEQASVKAAQEADEQKAKAEYLAEQKSKLLEAMPEWKDAKKAAVDQKAIADYLIQSMRVQPDEINSIDDHRLVIAVNKARLYDEMQAKLAKVKPNFQQPSVKAARGGTSQQTPANSKAQAMKRLRQTGDTGDAAAAFMHFID